MSFIKKNFMYEPPLAGDEDTVVILPLENGCEVPVAMYAQLVSLIPKGKVSCWEHIAAFLGKLYGREVKAYPDRHIPHYDTDNNPVPFWRVVSNRGVLERTTKEADKELLIQEGVPVVQRGSIAGSYKVDNYKEYMFDFGKLKVIRE